jgi:hypothetical protein
MMNLRVTVKEDPLPFAEFLGPRVGFEREASTRPESLNNQVIQGLVLGLAGDDGQYRRLGYFEANGLVCYSALQYEFQPAAQKLDYPWGKVNLPSLMVQSDDVLLVGWGHVICPCVEGSECKPTR